MKNALWTVLLGSGLALTAAAASAQTVAQTVAQSGEPIPVSPAGIPLSLSGPPATLVAPEGALMTVYLTTTLATDRNRTGDSFIATLGQPLVIDGWIVARPGQSVVGRIAYSGKGGRVKGVSSLELELREFVLTDGQQVSIRTQPMEFIGDTSRAADAGAIAATTGVGAIIGAISGGGRGVAIGAAAGAGAGVAGVLLTRGNETEVQPQALTFRLDMPLAISTMRAPQAFLAVTPADYALPAVPAMVPTVIPAVVPVVVPQPVTTFVAVQQPPAIVWTEPRIVRTYAPAPSIVIVDDGPGRGPRGRGGPGRSEERGRGRDEGRRGHGR